MSFDWRRWAEDLCGGQIGYADYEVAAMTDEQLAEHVKAWGEGGWRDYNRLFVKHERSLESKSPQEGG
jgi:hypothetical protein